MDSSTMEKLVEVVSQNPRGVMMWNDEIRAWFKSFTQYDSDNIDKWLKIFNRSRIVVDRIGRGTTQLDSPHINVIGTTQPEVLNRLVNDDFKESGLIDRILFAEVKTQLKYTDSDVDPEILRDWRRTIELLIALSDGKTDPIYIYLSAEAKNKFTIWKNEQNEILNKDEDKRLLVGKWDNYIYRFALALHCLENLQMSINNEISGDTFDKAINLTTYFQDQFYSFFGDKDNYVVRKMSELKKKIYNALPGEFFTGDAVIIAQENGMPERTVKRWLNEKSYFKRMRQGEYQKLIEL